MAEAMDDRDDQSIDVESYFKGKLMISLLDSWGVVHYFSYTCNIRFVDSGVHGKIIICKTFFSLKKSN